MVTSPAERNAAEVRRALGLAIRELRVRRGIETVSLGFVDSFLAAVERGETNLSFPQLSTLCAELGVRVSELVALYERNVAASRCLRRCARIQALRDRRRAHQQRAEERV
ncbi:transcriptional regulator [Conexibacter woesei]|uniref:HTH cro/C1-type domain-containing protein n=1 Tax=Conexibacter woesei (strain DSM 14684 / CCUG 47730 / CIP 108061 / JCM 11494 / NBRC 100937 / ID131577) TaxID=469383 RepID=D3FEB2_CONWI|nr:transcriptional regulator [Conexibacter woesei]ADB53604.1 hypothetical protein Cwoe_5196 [Conexibacter woesei DSM 14684]